MPNDSARDHARFPTTRGSAVRGVRSPDANERERSWEALARAYWKPAYKHVRVKWRAAEADAEDTIQAFFARALEKGFFATFDPERARFRTFFRVCLDRFVLNLRKEQTRHKRGGGVAHVQMDFALAERELFLAGASAWESPDACFDREWRRGLFASAIDALRAELDADGKPGCFELFEAYDLAGTGARPTYEELARARSLPVTTVTNHLAFARRELRRLVLGELERITETDDELRREAALLFGARRS